MEPFEFGWKVNLTDAISNTMERFFQQQGPNLNDDSIIETGVQCIFVGGCDGSGGHSIHNGLRNETMQKPNFKLAEMCVLMAHYFNILYIEFMSYS